MYSKKNNYTGASIKIIHVNLCKNTTCINYNIEIITMTLERESPYLNESIFSLLHCYKMFDNNAPTF